MERAPGLAAVRAPVWDLHAVPAASPTVVGCPRSPPSTGVDVTVAVEERCPSCALPATWDGVPRGLSGKQRHELHRKMRRVEREVPEARAVGSGAAPTSRPASTTSSSSTGARAWARPGSWTSAWRRSSGASRRCWPTAGAFRLWLLDAPGGPLASFSALEWDGTVGLYNSGFRPDAAALSPGLVLLAHVIRDAIERGKRRFDFLRGEERYKYDFGPTPEDVYRGDAPMTPAGMSSASPC